MPLNTDALKDSVNGHKPKAKRPNPNPEQPGSCCTLLGLS